jgi:adenosylcobinamide amidohydrolase
MPEMIWEELLGRPDVSLRRSGRFLVAELRGPHGVLSTSVQNGGQVDHVNFLLNHQSCEGTAHLDRHRLMTGGLEAYHELACAEAGVPAAETALMGTAANMNYVAVSTEEDQGVAVTAVVTAGVEGNATTAGDTASWRETDAGMVKVSYAGTINAMLLVHHPVTPAALARAVVTMTEGKSTGLLQLAVPSRQGVDLATGTGTDQYCVAAPVDHTDGHRPLTSASPHVKLGELIGLATRKATMEAVRWQNGLEPSVTRGVFHALGRYGVKEATFVEDISAFLEEAPLELLRKNLRSALYEPLVGAAAHALAAVCDRIRHGALPASVTRDARLQQAALVAANLAADVGRWPEFRVRLFAYGDADVKTLALAAIALGWSEKWRSPSSA